MQRKRKITHYLLPNQKRKWPVVAVKLRLATSRMDIYAKLDDFECTVEMCSEIIVHFFFSISFFLFMCTHHCTIFSENYTLKVHSFHQRAGTSLPWRSSSAGQEPGTFAAWGEDKAHCNWALHILLPSHGRKGRRGQDHAHVSHWDTSLKLLCPEI